MENQDTNPSAVIRSEIENDALNHLIMIRIHLDSINRILATEKELKGRWSVHSARHVQCDVRFVVEEIMLLSVAANQQAGTQITRAIRKAYKPGKIAKLLAHLNPNFFPIAISVVETDEVGIDGCFIVREGEQLTAEQAIDYWSRAGDKLHAKRSAMSPTDVLECLDQAKIFLKLTVDLLETFEVDVSGMGMWIGGHLNFGEAKSPVLLHGRGT